jgi:hypothetical protein
MNSTSEDIKEMLVADSSLGLVFASNLFIGKEPATPYNSVTIFDTPGFPDELLLDGSSNGNSYQYPSVQIRVRNTNYTVGWSLIENIKASLHGRARETWNGTLYSVIMCSSGPALLEWDDNSNVKFIVNFNIQRRKDV